MHEIVLLLQKHLHKFSHSLKLHSKNLFLKGYRMNIRKLGLALLLILSQVGTYADDPINLCPYTNSDMLKTLNFKISKTIEYAPAIPGLADEESAEVKSKIAGLFESLVKHGSLELSGSDKEIRPYFVGLQAIIEHVLSGALNKEVSSLKGFIHTPMPPTALCTTGEITNGLVDPIIENDPSRLFTVLARSMIVRNYLHKGGDLYAIYPGNGFKKRTAEQQAIYIQELINYPHHLFDVPLKCDSIPQVFIGATYIFEDQSGESFVFAINMTQANDPQDFGKYSLWYGPLSQHEIQKRVTETAIFMDDQGFSVLKEASELL